MWRILGILVIGAIVVIIGAAIALGIHAFRDSNAMLKETREQIETEAEIRKAVSKVRSDMQTMHVALVSYFVDSNSYPTSVKSGGKLPLISDAWPFANVPTFSRRSSRGDQMTITTPISYVKVHPSDPFSSANGSDFPYAYYSRVETPGWVLFSRGPDLDWDIDPEIDYTSADISAVRLKTYDPTNGLVSGGDIVRVFEDPMR